LYSGTVGLANGVDQIVRAAKQVQDTGRTDIRFVILGDGNDLQRVRRLADELEVALIEFLPEADKERLNEELAKADIGLVCFAPFPVLEANGATKFFDYLSSGLPVVINYLGWQADYLSRFDCGLSSPQGDMESFTENIRRLADDPALRSRFAMNGRQLLLDRFDRNKLSLRMLEILKAAQNDKN
jgi:glycosyltransferase involved in cell wall biosynthesis